MKSISIIGSTGSIGTQVLDVVSRLPERLSVVGMAAHHNIGLLAEQIRIHKPRIVSVGTEDGANRLRELIGGLDGLVIMWGREGLERVATASEAETTVVSVAGAIGIAPTVAAISAGKDIALASKEVLVTAGSIVSRMVQDRGVKLLPIDSEHSAIFQCLQGEDRSRIRKLMLTASGGALRDIPTEHLSKVTVAQALAHPTWSMGRKITIDSATLMNKALEIIEARWLFGVEPSMIEVVIHPQSIVHSMVEFEDGSVMAQLGVPDMRVPIQYSLLYPERIDTGLPRLDIIKKGTLTFNKPDPERYPGLNLAYRALKEGGTMPAVLNAANEAAAALFLEERIGYLEIVEIVRRVMDRHSPISQPNLDQVMDADAWARMAATAVTEEK